ncbi:MAG: hypothetical protein EA389_11410 [Ilumatobacter sp.]|nr:MAG: hypothetical protein EA389_11410 [Ilumatobacter sp.]
MISIIAPALSAVTEPAASDTALSALWITVGVLFAAHGLNNAHRGFDATARWCHRPARSS